MKKVWHFSENSNPQVLFSDFGTFFGVCGVFDVMSCQSMPCHPAPIPLLSAAWQRQGRGSDHSLPPVDQLSRFTSVIKISTESGEPPSTSTVTRVISSTRRFFCSGVRPSNISMWYRGMVGFQRVDERVNSEANSGRLSESFQRKVRQIQHPTQRIRRKYRPGAGWPQAPGPTAPR